jgi:hypothetical protein
MQLLLHERQNETFEASIAKTVGVVLDSLFEMVFLESGEARSYHLHSCGVRLLITTVLAKRTLLWCGVYFAVNLFLELA